MSLLTEENLIRLERGTCSAQDAAGMRIEILALVKAYEILGAKWEEEASLRSEVRAMLLRCHDRVYNIDANIPDADETLRCDSAPAGLLSDIRALLAKMPVQEALDG